jgi:hypothetical protein
LDQIYRELERGKEAGEFIQVKGNSVHGFFAWNMSHMFPMKFGESKEDPDFAFPPEQKPCLPIQRSPEAKKKARTKGKLFGVVCLKHFF